MTGGPPPGCGELQIEIFPLRPRVCLPVRPGLSTFLPEGASTTQAPGAVAQQHRMGFNTGYLQVEGRSKRDF